MSARTIAFGAFAIACTACSGDNAAMVVPNDAARAGDDAPALDGLADDGTTSGDARLDDAASDGAALLDSRVDEAASDVTAAGDAWMNDALEAGNDRDAARDGQGSNFDVQLVDAPAGSCNAYANGAPLIEETRSPTTVPTPQGGPISDGLYFETSFVVYTGAGGASGPDGVHHQFEAMVSGNRIDVVYLDVSTGVEGRRTATLTRNGTMLHWAFTCPSNLGALDYGYDATTAADGNTTEITLYDTVNPAKLSSFRLTR
jgi:hypothetical protein